MFHGFRLHATPVTRSTLTLRTEHVTRCQVVKVLYHLRVNVCLGGAGFEQQCGDETASGSEFEYGVCHAKGSLRELLAISGHIRDANAVACRGA